MTEHRFAPAVLDRILRAMTSVLLLFLVGEAGWAADEGSETATPLAPIHRMIASGKHPRLKHGDLDDFTGQLAELYAGDSAALLWVSAGRPTKQALALVEELERAGERGLHPGEFEVETLRQWLSEPFWQNTPAPEATAAFDLALSLEALRFVHAVSYGRVDPRGLGFKLDATDRTANLPEQIRRIARSERPVELIYEREPKWPVYGALRSALSRYRSLATTTSSPKLNFPAKLEPGARHPDVPALRTWLQALGDLEAAPSSAMAIDVYDPDLVAAVKSFQRRHGLAADGVIGKGTLAQLTKPLGERIQQIELALERLRWLPGELPGRYLLVNIPSFELIGGARADETAAPDLSMNVIVGQAVEGRRTPIFHSDMSYVVFHPYWNVPDAIANKELIPIIRRNPAYLSRNNLEIVPRFSPKAAAYAPNGANLDRLAAGGLRLRMRPGPRNALGLVKFSFPNENNVYLHSTPAKGLFQRARRDFSHGCIRVEDPVRLAEWVFRDDSAWTRDRIVAAMNGDREQTVTLKQPIPVYIFYSTVLADAEGRPRFFEDIYGHDQSLQTALARGYPYPIARPLAVTSGKTGTDNPARPGG